MAVITSFATSLDGFIADPGGHVGPLFDWYQNGDVEVPLPGYGITFHMTEPSARYWSATMPTEEGAPGALVCGRGVFDYTSGWDGNPPGGNPTFVVTHRPAPEGWPPIHGGAPYVFVTDGVESAIKQAVTAAREATSACRVRASCSRPSTPAWSTRCGSTWYPSSWAAESAISRPWIRPSSWRGPSRSLRAKR